MNIIHEPCIPLVYPTLGWHVVINDHLQRGRHLVGILKGLRSPIPDLLHAARDAIAMFGAIVTHFFGGVRLGTVSKRSRYSGCRTTYAEWNYTIQHDRWLEDP